MATKSLDQLKKALPTHLPKVPVNRAAERRLKLVGGLVGAIWASGLVGHYTKAREWPALYLYALGSLGVAGYLGKKEHEWEKIYVTRKNLKPALFYGFLLGGALFASDVFNTFAYYRKGGKPMKEMEDILIKQKFVYLFPALIVAEEFLWRGTLFSALQEKGWSKKSIAGMTTLLYVVNHYAVAPVGLKERSMMAGMAVPIGLVNSLLVFKTKNIWAGVIVHTMTMVSMLADIFVIPKLAKKFPAKTAK